jgi:HK97 gp10 family phage protein
MAKTFEQQITDFTRALEKQVKKAEADSKKFVTMSCAEVERTAKTIMRDSPTNPDVAYGKKGHHPSFAGNPPAPDTGTLMRSITHEVSGKGKQVVGEVGSIIHNSDYPKYLEYGTSKMKPRPWLSTSLTRCQSWMSNLWKEIFK